MAENTVPEKTHLASPGQTVGPFFAFGLDYAKKHEVVFPHSPGAIVLGGTVYDGAGAPIPDAVIEIFSADSDGTVPRSRGAFRRDDHSFTGFGRASTTDDGHYDFWTRNPGSVNGEAPFFAAMMIVMWRLLTGMTALTGLEFEQIFHAAEKKQKSGS